MVQELLDFAHLSAGEVMVPRVRVNGLRVGMPFDEVVRVVRRHPHTRYPIYRGDLDRADQESFSRSGLEQRVPGAEAETEKLPAQRPSERQDSNPGPEPDEQPEPGSPGAGRQEPPGSSPAPPERS